MDTHTCDTHNCEQMQFFTRAARSSSEQLSRLLLHSCSSIHSRLCNDWDVDFLSQRCVETFPVLNSGFSLRWRSWSMIYMGMIYYRQNLGRGPTRNLYGFAPMSMQMDFWQLCVLPRCVFCTRVWDICQSIRMFTGTILDTCSICLRCV
jgi:hypothetical protein